MNGMISATVTTTGSAGSATGTASLTLSGYVSSIKVDWSASAPVTSDITIVEQGGFGRTLYTKSNSATDITLYPYHHGDDNTGATIAGVYGRIYVPSVPVLISVSGCDALAAACVVSVIMTDNS